jgi:hypothetical protein
MDDGQFREFIAELITQLPPRAFDRASFEQALGYPWSRPEGSFLLEVDHLRPLAEIEGRPRGEILSKLTGADRVPVLAIGSNASPEVLERKLSHFPAAADRTVLGLAGRLHDFDIGIAAQPALYGSMPATLFPSPGTAVSATVLYLNRAQLTQLAWTELSYRLGRLRTRFEPAEDLDLELEEVLAFVSRWGAFCVDGHPVALAAIPAAGRRARPLSQEEALDAAAALALGPEASAELLVRAVFEETEALAERIAETIHVDAQRFESDRWTPIAGG